MPRVTVGLFPSGLDKEAFSLLLVALLVRSNGFSFLNALGFSRSLIHMMTLQQEIRFQRTVVDNVCNKITRMSNKHIPVYRSYCYFVKLNLVRIMTMMMTLVHFWMLLSSIITLYT